MAGFSSVDILSLVSLSGEDRSFFYVACYSRVSCFLWHPKRHRDELLEPDGVQVGPGQRALIDKHHVWSHMLLASRRFRDTVVKAVRSTMPENEKEYDLMSNRDAQLRDESQSPLLSPSEDTDQILPYPPATISTPNRPASDNRPSPQRQSSIVRPPTEGQRRTPRTTNRVHFDLDLEGHDDDSIANGRARSSDDDALWLDDDDYELSDQGRSGVRNSGQTIPLLTDIEAPSVTLATSEDFFPEDHLESARPRSGLNMAFMNMANSIIGAGIIGQPYALRQAGLATGILLLTVLTVTVDWTIRLIVINSKMSGADSFQATMQHCFGRSGLIAISVAQWAFAFGGMVAFCIIVGDTIPHVLSALFPSLREMTFLWLLTDRRAVIVLFVLGVSYPLSLYRDIAKV